MELIPLEQAAALLHQSRVPVIIIPEHPSSDALAAGLSLLLVLEKSGKMPRIVCPEFTLPPGHSFLPKSDAIQHNLTSLRNFIITVDVSKTKLDSLSYTIQGDKLNIHLTPKNGFYEERDVTTSAGPFAYDAIITLDVPSLDRLGDLYRNNAEFFYQTPVLNIDHRATNARFGHVNLVDVVASSVSEIVFELIKRLGYETIDEQIATSLLTGIISKTKVFQSHTVTPRSLSIASHLISAGARRDAIIQNLYQTKTLTTLKLWGRALAKIKSSDSELIVWTNITQADLEATKTSVQDAAGVLDELMINTPNARYVALFIEQGEKTQAYVAGQTGAPEPKLPAGITQREGAYYSGTVNTPLADAEQRVLKELRGGLTGNGK